MTKVIKGIPVIKILTLYNVYDIIYKKLNKIKERGV